MKPRDFLLAESLTEEQYNTLSSEEAAIWWSRPTRDHIVGAKHAMYFRVTLLIATTIYYSYRYGDYGEFTVLLFFLYCYEGAYYILRKEKEEKDYAEARHRYMEKVEQVSRHRS
jgi:hypothetical protein